MRFEPLFWKVLVATTAASAALMLVALPSRGWAFVIGAPFGALVNLVALTVLGLIGGAIYVGVFLGVGRALGLDLRSLRR